MYKLFTQTALVATFTVFAFGQAPQTSQGATQNNDPTKPAQGTLNSPPTTSNPTGSASSTGSTSVGSTTAGSTTAGLTSAGSQSFRGVLMDASCSAIQSRSSQSTTTGSALSADATRNRESLPTSTTQSQTLTAGSSTGIGGSASATGSTAGTSGSVSGTTNIGGTTATRNTTADTTGVNSSHEGQATAQAGTPASNVGDSSANSLQTYTGVGDRNRTASTAPQAASGDWTSVREKYKDCKVTPTTSTFAIMSNGQLYMIDDTAGSLRQRMSANTTSGASTEFQTFTVMGTPQGDRISVTSVQ